MTAVLPSAHVSWMVPVGIGALGTCRQNVAPTYYPSQMPQRTWRVIIEVLGGFCNIEYFSDFADIRRRHATWQLPSAPLRVLAGMALPA